MAKSDKKKGKKGNDPVIRRVRTKEDRKRPSVFMRLKTDEAFKGVALFEPDPELDDNAGYFEYYDHFDKQANQYVPCAGDACPFCAANDNPSTRALTAWYFPEAADVKDKIKIFTMNYSTINDIADEAEEEDGITGKVVRIKRLSDKGDYKVKVNSGKPLSKAELKKAMALLEEKLKDVGGKVGTLEGIVLRQLQTQLERLKALDALDDDDDDDDDEPTSKKGNSRKGNPAEDEDDDDEDEDEDDEDDDDEDDDSEDDDDSDDEDEDDDDSEDDDDDDSDDEEEEDEETESEEISGAAFEVVKVHEKDEIFDLKNDDGKSKMWLGEGVEVDYDEIKKGVNVKIDAAQDDEGDWIITAMSLVKPKGGKKADPKKGGKKGGKKK